MPRGRPKKGMIVELPEETEPASVEATEEESEADKLIADAKTTQAPRPPLVWLYRIDPDSGEEKFLGKFKVGMVNETMCAQRYGGGKFVAYTRKPKASGGYLYAGKDEYLVDDSIKPEKSDGVAVVPVEANGKGSDFIERMLLLQMDMSSKMTTAMMGAFAAMAGAAKQPPPATDPLLLELVRAMVSKPAADPMTFAKDMLAMMKEGGTTDPLDQLKKVLEIKELLGGSESGGMDEMGLIGKGLDVLGGMVAKQAAAPADVPVSVPSQPARTELPAPVPSNEPPHTLPFVPRRRPVEKEESVKPGQGIGVVPKAEPLRLWKQPVAQLLPRAPMLMVWLSPDAAALNLWRQSDDAQKYDIRLDIGTIPDEAKEDEAKIEAIADAFVSRALNDFQLHRVPGMNQEVVHYISDVMYGLFDIAMESDEEEEPESPVAGAIVPEPSPD
jgi:hypothetical protein